MKIIELKETVTASNDRDAQVLRQELTQKGTLLINLMASPGAGKTTLLERTIRDLKERYAIEIGRAHVRNWRSKGHLAHLMRPTKFPEIPVSLERNTEVFRHPLL